MLVFAAITPHSPLLLESISRNQVKRLERTREAMFELERELYAVFPDTIVLLCEHPTMYESSFSLNISDPYHFDLRTFGDFSAPTALRPDMETIDRLQRDLRKKKQPFTLSSDNALDYSSAVPLHFLTANLKTIKLIPITYTNLDAKSHFQFGQALKDILFNSNKRIAVIVSGDMSQALESESPAGFHPDGAEFDIKFQELIVQKNTAGLLKMNETLLSNARQSIYKPTLILFGLLENSALSPEILSYEAPFGVGCLVANLNV